MAFNTRWAFAMLVALAVAVVANQQKDFLFEAADDQGHLQVSGTTEM